MVQINGFLLNILMQLIIFEKIGTTIKEPALKMIRLLPKKVLTRLFHLKSGDIVFSKTHESNRLLFSNKSGFTKIYSWNSW